VIAHLLHISQFYFLDLRLFFAQQSNAPNLRLTTNLGLHPFKLRFPSTWLPQFCYVFYALVDCWVAQNQEPPPINTFPDVIDDDTIEKAGRSTACKTEMKKRVAVKTWFPGVCFAMSMPLACIMEGYGLVLIAGFFASAAFKIHFGCPKLSEGVFNCEIPVQWQAALIDGALGG
jgi:hypothetical protein